MPNNNTPRATERAYTSNINCEYVDSDDSDASAMELANEFINYNNKDDEEEEESSSSEDEESEDDEEVVGQQDEEEGGEGSDEEEVPPTPKRRKKKRSNRTTGLSASISYDNEDGDNNLDSNDGGGFDALMGASSSAELFANRRKVAVPGKPSAKSLKAIDDCTHKTIPIPKSMEAPTKTRKKKDEHRECREHVELVHQSCTREVNGIIAAHRRIVNECSLYTNNCEGELERNQSLINEQGKRGREIAGKMAKLEEDLAKKELTIKKLKEDLAQKEKDKKSALSKVNKLNTKVEKLKEKVDNLERERDQLKWRQGSGNGRNNNANDGGYNGMSHGHEGGLDGYARGGSSRGSGRGGGGSKKNNTSSLEALELFRRKKMIELEHKQELAKIDQEKRSNAAAAKKKEKKQTADRVTGALRLMTQNGAVTGGQFNRDGMLNMVSCDSLSVTLLFIAFVDVSHHVFSCTNIL